MAEKALAPYKAGTKAWFTDKELGWISATLTKNVSVSGSGEVLLSFVLDEGGATRDVKTTTAKLDQPGGPDEILPPLRNPPLLEATDDLTNLSYLNEPAGECLEYQGVCVPSLMQTYARCSLACNPFAIQPASDLHVQRHRLDCSESVRLFKSLLSRDHPSIQR